MHELIHTQHECGGQGGMHGAMGNTNPFLVDKKSLIHSNFGVLDPL